MYSNPEGLMDQHAGTTINISRKLTDHTSYNREYGTGLRPKKSTVSDGNINKPWICEPRVNLPKEIMGSETEALIVSGINIVVGKLRLTFCSGTIFEVFHMVLDLRFKIFGL